MSSALPAELQAAVDASRSRLDGFDRIEYFPEVTSTNDLAMARAAHGAPHGTVVVADAQTAGRGRLGRVWHSPPEAGLYISAVLRAESWDSALSLVTLAAGIGVVRGLREATGLVGELKWPNDVVVGRPWRKVAGILSETVSSSSGVDAVVIGVGINIRADAYPPDLAHRATAVEVELGRGIDRWACAVAVLAALSNAGSRLANGDRDWVAPEWRRYGAAGLRGAPVRWQDGDTARQGSAVDIDDAGALIIDVAGTRERVISGEVFWERLNKE